MLNVECFIAMSNPAENGEFFSKWPYANRPARQDGNVSH